MSVYSSFPPPSLFLSSPVCCSSSPSTIYTFTLLLRLLLFFFLVAFFLIILCSPFFLLSHRSCPLFGINRIILASTDIFWVVACSHEFTGVILQQGHCICYLICTIIGTYPNWGNNLQSHQWKQTSNQKPHFVLCDCSYYCTWFNNFMEGWEIFAWFVLLLVHEE